MADNSDTRDGEFDAAARARHDKSGNGALVAMICLGLLLVGGMIFALVYFLGGGSGGGNLDSEMLAYLPAETNMMAGADVEELMKSDKVKGLVDRFFHAMEGEETLGKLKQAGISTDQVSRMLLGGKSSYSAAINLFLGEKVPLKALGDDSTIVIRFKSAIDKTKIANAIEMSEQSKNGKTYYKSEKRKHHFMYFPSDTVMVVVANEKQIDDLTTNAPGKGHVSDEIKELSGKFSKGQVWGTVSRTIFGDDLKKLEGKKGNLFAPAEVIEAVSGMRGAGFYMAVDGDKLTLAIGLLCSEAKVATKAAEALKKEVDKIRKDGLDKIPLVGRELSDLPSEAKGLATELQQSIKVESDGAMLSISASLSIAKLAGLYELPKKQEGPRDK